MTGSHRRGDGRRLDRHGAARAPGDPLGRDHQARRPPALRHAFITPSGSAWPVHVRSRLCLPGEHGGDVFHTHAMEVQMKAAGLPVCLV